MLGGKIAGVVTSKPSHFVLLTRGKRLRCPPRQHGASGHARAVPARAIAAATAAAAATARAVAAGRYATNCRRKAFGIACLAAQHLEGLPLDGSSGQSW
jgi:hypothetical protein